MAARGKVCALRASEPDQEAIGGDSNERNPESGAAGGKNGRFPICLARGGARDYNRHRSEPGSIPGQTQMGNIGLTNVQQFDSKTGSLFDPAKWGHLNTAVVKWLDGWLRCLAGRLHSEKAP